MRDHIRLQQRWASALGTARRAVAEVPTTATVYHALGLAWQAARAVTMPASPSLELGWMRLCESLLDAWHGLDVLGHPPCPVPFEVAAPESAAGGLADAPALRAAVADLVTAAAGAIRRLAIPASPHREPDSFIDLAAVAADLEHAVKEWT